MALHTQHQGFGPGFNISWRNICWRKLEVRDRIRRGQKWQKPSSKTWSEVRWIYRCGATDRMTWRGVKIVSKRVSESVRDEGRLTCCWLTDDDLRGKRGAACNSEIYELRAVHICVDFLLQHSWQVIVSRVSDPVWYWPDPDPDPTSQDKPDPDTSVLKIFHLFYDEF